MLSSNRNDGEGEPPSKSPPVGHRGAATTSVFESALGRLIRSEFAPDELPSLVATFAREDASDKILSLGKDDAQAFIDVIDEVLDRLDLPLESRKICLKQLYRTCGYHELLPKALKAPIWYDRSGSAKYHGGYADVWKGECRGREVAVKVIRTCSKSNLQRVVGRFYKEVVTWKSLRHPNILPLIGVTMFEAQFAMASEWMVNGNINEFVEANPDANRLNLLGGVARGLIYMHQQGMIHGDLKGANILIDQTGRALLADFGLLMIVPNTANPLPSSSLVQGGTGRWMSPELIFPQDFGLKASRPTKASDCYSLGMVIYETISGHPPFHGDRDLTVLMKVLRGERPPRGVGFAEGLWKMLEQCWVPQPSERPNVEDVLQRLDMCSNLSVPPPGADVVMGGLGLDGLDAPSHDQPSELGFDGSHPSFSANEKGRPPARSSSPPSFLTPDTHHFVNAENLHRGVPSVDSPYGVTSSLQLRTVSEMMIPGGVLPAVPLSTAQEGPRLFQGPPTRAAATPLTQGARTHNYPVFGEFVSNTFRPGRLPEPAYLPPSMSCGTSQSASASSSTRPTGGRSDGKGQKQGPIPASFMKNPKRKRLARACDACHKSKRRCDGTGPCSNCFFASKDCTYTDSSGRPVPPPKGSDLSHNRFRDDIRDVGQPQETVATHDPPRAQISYTLALSSFNTVTLPPTSRKRRRSGSDPGTPSGSGSQWTSDALMRPAGLEANIVRDLVNLFFAHCHPGRMIIHKPTFMAALSQNRVASHLILAMCAMSAPFSQSPQVKSQPPRLAGIKFHEDALNILIDSSGRLICDASLQTVQTLCLLEMHDVVAQYSWTKCYRYLDIASKILFETLDIAPPESPPLSPKPTIEEMNRMTDRECARRCYWIIYFLHVLSTACTRNVRRFSAEGMLMRLPVDETSFELGIQSQTPEYLDEMAPKTNYVSEFGHLTRITALFSQMEDAVSIIDDDDRFVAALQEASAALKAWEISLPDHLRYSEDNLHIMNSMYETPANTGPWCFFYMHALHSCCEMSAASEIQKRFSSKVGIPKEASEAGDRCLRVVESVGSRAKNLNYLITPTLWVVSRYFKDNPTMLAVDSDFETVWGWKACEISETWRKHNEAKRLEADRTRKVTGGLSSGQTIGRHLSLRGPPPITSSSSIVQTDDTGDSHLLHSSITSRYTEYSERTLPSLKSFGLLDSFENRRTNSDLKSALPPLSKAREW